MKCVCKNSVKLPDYFQVGKVYTFHYTNPHKTVVVVLDENWKEFRMDNGTFLDSFTPEPRYQKKTQGDKEYSIMKPNWGFPSI